MKSSRRTAVALGLAAAVVLTFQPALDGGFLDWDDNLYVTENAHIRGTWPATIRWAFTTVHTGNWIPLTWLSHALDYRLFGLDPRGHHLSSVLLHALNTALVFVLFARMTGAAWPSAAVAALFGLHPLRVESVAWISERKDVLCGSFWLVTMLLHVRAARTGARAARVGVAIGFLAALLSKPMAITLPPALLLLDYWPLRRLSWRAAREKLPLVAIVAVAAAWTVASQAAGQALKSIGQLTLADRIANALVAYARYLQLTVWPAGLSPWHSHPALDGPPLAATTVLASLALLVAVSAVAVAARHTRPHLLVGWLWYLGTLVPVIGLVQTGGHGIAERFTYLPAIGVLVAVVWEVAARVRGSAWRGRAAVAACVVAAVTCGVLTTRQIRVWRDPVTLWTSTLRANPRAAIAWVAIGDLLQKSGRRGEALGAYRRALEIRPDYLSTHLRVASLLLGEGRLAGAAKHYRVVLAALPESAAHRTNLAEILTRQGNTRAARRQLEAALGLDPSLPEAHNNLGILLAEEGELRRAVAHFRAALRARPDFAAARRNLEIVGAELARSSGSPDAAAPEAP